MARQQDILSIPPDPIYDAVLMNPGSRDSVIVRHAWGFVRSGGVMVALLGCGAGDALAELLGEVEECGENCMILTARKPSSVTKKRKNP